MKLPILKQFDLLQLHECDGHWWINLCAVELDDFNGALLSLEGGGGTWKYDVLYVSEFLRWLEKKDEENG